MLGERLGLSWCPDGNRTALTALGVLPQVAVLAGAVDSPISRGSFQARLVANLLLGKHVSGWNYGSYDILVLVLT